MKLDILSSGKDSRSVIFVDFYLSTQTFTCMMAVTIGLTLPVKLADMKHLNWSRIFWLLTPQHE